MSLTTSFRVKIKRQTMLLRGYDIYIYINVCAAAYVYTSFCGVCFSVCLDFSDHFKGAKSL